MCQSFNHRGLNVTFRFPSRGVSSILCFALIGCGFDPASPEYDERRYVELQKANCNDIASAASSRLMSKTPEKPEAILERCRSLQQLTLEEYRRVADYARQHDGQWNISQALNPDPAAGPPAPLNPSAENDPK